jgi:hypothetical protein
MSDSEALTILKAIDTRLAVASVVIDGVVHTKPVGLTVDRDQIAPVKPAQVKGGPFINIVKGGQLPTQRKHYKDMMLIRTMEVVVSVYALATGTRNSEALDPATNWVIKALQSEPTLGGHTHWVSEEGEDDFFSLFDDSMEVVAMREMKLHFEFHTRTDNPEARS